MNMPSSGQACDEPRLSAPTRNYEHPSTIGGLLQLDGEPNRLVYACRFPKPPTGRWNVATRAGILSTGLYRASIMVTEALKRYRESLSRTPHPVSFDLWSSERQSLFGEARLVALSAVNETLPIAGEGSSSHHALWPQLVQSHEHTAAVDFAAMYNASLQRHCPVQRALLRLSGRLTP